MRGKNCHPLANILKRILTSTDLHEGSRLPPPRSNTYMGIVAWTHFNKGSNILNHISTWNYLHEGSRLPPPLANILNRILTWTYLHEGSRLPPFLANILNRILTCNYLHEGSKLPPPLANILNRIWTWTEWGIKTATPSGQYIEYFGRKLTEGSFSEQTSAAIECGNFTRKEAREADLHNVCFGLRTRGLAQLLAAIILSLLKKWDDRWRAPLMEKNQTSVLWSHAGGFQFQFPHSEYHSQFPNTTPKFPNTTPRFRIPPPSFRIPLPVSEYHSLISEYHCPVSECHFPISEYHFQFPNPSFRIYHLQFPDTTRQFPNTTVTMVVVAKNYGFNCPCFQLIHV